MSKLRNRMKGFAGSASRYIQQRKGRNTNLRRGKEKYRKGLLKNKKIESKAGVDEKRFQNIH